MQKNDRRYYKKFININFYFIKIMSKDIQISSNRSFGIVFFIVFLIIAFYPLLISNEIRIWSILVSIVFLILGLLNSKILLTKQHLV